MSNGIGEVVERESKPVKLMGAITQMSNAVNQLQNLQNKIRHGCGIDTKVDSKETLEPAIDTTVMACLDQGPEILNTQYQALTEIIHALEDELL